jgi:hypothetical protein
VFGLFFEGRHRFGFGLKVQQQLTEQQQAAQVSW